MNALISHGHPRFECEKHVSVCVAGVVEATLFCCSYVTRLCQLKMYELWM